MPKLKFKITTIGLLFSALLAIATVVVIASSLTAIRGINEIESYWEEYKSGPAEKAVHLQELNAALGYGGMIHQFKNYILRQDEGRVAKIKIRAAKAISAIKAYKDVGVNETEEKALITIEKMVNEYLSALKIAQKAAASGSLPMFVDGQIKINDSPAIGAIGVLNDELAGSREATSEVIHKSVINKINFTTISAIVIGILLISIFGFQHLDLGDHLIKWLAPWVYWQMVNLIQRFHLKIVKMNLVT